MLITDAHEVIYDTYGDATDIWLARWPGGDTVDVFRGDFINNRVLLQHVRRINVNYTELGLSQERTIMVFCKEFGEYLQTMANDSSFKNKNK
jgi:hypothetical protein